MPNTIWTVGGREKQRITRTLQNGKGQVTPGNNNNNNNNKDHCTSLQQQQQQQQRSLYLLNMFDVSELLFLFLWHAKSDNQNTHLNKKLNGFHFSSVGREQNWGDLLFTCRVSKALKNTPTPGPIALVSLSALPLNLAAKLELGHLAKKNK